MDILLHFSKNSINFITIFSNFTKKDKKIVIFIVYHIFFIKDKSKLSITLKYFSKKQILTSVLLFAKI